METVELTQRAIDEKGKMTRQQLSEPGECNLEDSEDEAHTGTE
jgi:hypothetical protein